MRFRETADMPVIDSDAHVVETEQTWDFMEPADARFRPVVMYPEGKKKGFWYCDGKLRRRAQHVVTAEELRKISDELGRNVAVPDGTLQMEDIPARIRHMDQLGVDVQVLHSTIFIEQVANREDAEIAVCKSWNRWLASIWKQGEGRLRWSCVLPLRTLDVAIEEMRFCRDNGACAVFLRCIEGNRLLHDPYFYPLYEAAAELGLAMAVHVGNGNEANCELLTQHISQGGGFWKFRMNTAGACHSLIASDMMRQFPKLHFVFLEAGSQWLPFVISDLCRRLSHLRQPADTILKENRIWVACETCDDLPAVLTYAGDDSLVIGTDYGHADQSSEIEAIYNLKKIGALPAATLDKMIDDNPRVLYGL
jgi:predicted TIM-barrel fold metal-dependent hydrolase